LRKRVAQLFEEVDVVLTPTVAAVPWPAEESYPREIAGQPAGPRDHAIFFIGWANIAGVPAINLPAALSRSGLPIGVQIAAGFGVDAALLEFASELETDHPPPSLLPEM